MVFKLDCNGSLGLVSLRLQKENAGVAKVLKNKDDTGNGMMEWFGPGRNL